MAEKFCNPVSFTDGKRHTNPDPFVLRWCGKYYCYATDEFGVKISVSDDLTEWRYLGYGISEKEYHHYWAPSVLYLNGLFYMYYSNIPADEPDCHQQHLKLAVSHSPEGPFVYQKTFFDQFSIDSHPLMWNGELYMLYSVNDWLGTEDKVSGTCILMDKMKSPWEFEGNPKPVILPTRPQEIYAADRFGDGRDWYTIEGACTVVRDGMCWMLYSANAYENVDYFVGTTVAMIKKHASKMKWEKYPDEYTWVPLLRKNALVEGTGHNTVAKAPNLVDEWIVYHGRSALEELKPGTEQREMRIDPLYFSGKKMFCFGPSAEPCHAPEKPEIKIQNKQVYSREILCDGELFYRAEFWISGKKEHTGCRYGIYLDYQDEKNYTELQIYTGQNKIRVMNCMDGILVNIKEEKLPKQYDYTVPHRISIQRNLTDYRITTDEEKEILFSVERRQENAGTIGICPYFSEISVHDFTMTCHGELAGKELRNLSAFYNVAGVTADQNGLSSADGKIRLEKKAVSYYAENYTEEFSLEVTAEKNRISFEQGEENFLDVKNKKQVYSVYHKIRNGEEYFIVDGKLQKREKIKDTGINSVDICGLKLISYRYTKN
ncbi:glycoside hydrolase family 43 protein [Blautia sp. MSJ-19]|uniref:glycoside hydrolase family 43 protein n=1 Tax=Blautia sp. MSJ-19 TaxID=2841517 RepID=UPI001C0EFDA2|nr:glycoside hydrolase family 43 protein [Blautia sp. MSJ-19]MBU5482011.1 glycoside hydrolase family 43 protein [Blautia sp. MSJ-19]